MVESCRQYESKCQRSTGEEEPKCQEESPGQDDPISQHLAESIAFGRYVVSTWTDMLRVRARHALIVGLLSLAALPIFVIVVGLAFHMIMTSLAVAISEWTGLPLWASELLIGTTVLVFVIGGTWLALHGMNRRNREKTIQDYEQQQENQRNSLGADVHEQAMART